MATTRTFKQFGQAYGGTQATVTASIDGVEVFSGAVNTLDEPFPNLPQSGVNFGVEMFTWTEDVAFSGTKELTLTVAGSPLLLTTTEANYCVISDPSNPGQWISSGSTGFGGFYSQTIGGTVYADPFTNETIDGVAQDTTDPSLTGQWYWIIPAGSTFTATININPGLV